MDWLEWESNGRYGLSAKPGAYGYDDGSIGRGDGQVMMYFHSLEGRAYYKQAEEAREQTCKVARELQWMDNAVARLFTAKGKVRRKVALELAEMAERRKRNG